MCIGTNSPENVQRSTQEKSDKVYPQIPGYCLSVGLCGIQPYFNPA